MAYWNNIGDEVTEVIAFAQLETQYFAVNEVNNITLFLGILRLSQCDAAILLHSFGLTYTNTRETAARYFRGVEPPGVFGRLKQALLTLTSAAFGVPLAKNVNGTLEIANELAQAATINMLPEHLVLSLLQQKEPEVMALLSRFSIDIKKLHKQVDALAEQKAEYGQNP
ncbi:MAG: Clp protease N-terminal domain-containing protein [Candidatus Obscuribacterales bacterium]|nr:Clp protease N-terminal domain-containing protein [Candidatus Obscuribacterales bacterium]